MDKVFLEAAINAPYESFEKSFSKVINNKEYLFREKLKYKDTLQIIYLDIECQLADSDYTLFHGSVDLRIEVDRFKNEHKENFNSLYVNPKITSNGIGTQLMLEAFNVIRLLKEYYHINETITFNGWLSISDRDNGNWRRSVPFYYHVGELAQVNHYFLVCNNDCHINSVEEFFDAVGDTDGTIVYEI